MLETKKLSLIIVSDYDLDLSKISCSGLNIAHAYTGQGRKNFLENLAAGISESADIIIRLNGSKSLDDSVISEANYAELFFSDSDESNFNQEELESILREFKSRKRNFGS